MTGLAALGVDDEAPALDELMYLLRNCPLVTRAEGACSAHDALGRLEQESFDVVLADIRMPGLSGLEMVEALSHTERRPAVVFVTAHDNYALDAFRVGATGYLLKPLDAARLSEVLGRIGDSRPNRDRQVDDMANIAIESPGRTKILHRSEVEWVEAAGDYVRLHTRDQGHGYLVRIPIGLLEERWTAYGFSRIHRGYLVHLDAISELRTDGTQTVVQVRDHYLPVSRRQTADLRDRLVRHATRGNR